MRYVRNYILVITIVAITAVIGLRLLWFFFMVNSYRPEWFLLVMGLIFISVGVWVSTEWYKLHHSRHAGSEPLDTTKDFQEKFGLSTAEKEVLDLMARGMSNMEIADSRNVSVNTIKTHVSNIYQKLGVRSRVQVLARIKNIA